MIIRKFFCNLSLGIFLCFLLNAQYIYGNNKIDSLNIELTKSLPDSQRIDVLLKLFYENMQHDERQDAYHNLSQAFSLAKKSNDKFRLASAYLNMGTYNNNISNYVDAIDYLLDALQLFREVKHKKGEATTLMNLGLTYTSMKDYAESVNYYHQSEVIYRQINEPEKAAIVKYLYGINLLEKGLPLAAIKIFKSLIDEKKAISEQQKNECLLYIGTANLKVGFLDSALFYLNSAYSYFDSTNNSLAKIVTGTRLCQLYLHQGQFNRVIDSVHIYLDNAIFLKDRDSQLQLNKILSEAYKEKGDIINAYLYLQRYYELKDKLFNESSLRQLSDLQKKHAEVQHQHELALFMEKERNRKLINFSVIVFLVLIIGALFYRFVDKQRINRKLEISNHQLEEKKAKLESTNHELKNTLEVLKVTQEKLFQQEKIASLGKVTAGIAHEIQNPLNFVTNFATLNNDLIAELNNELSKEDRQEALTLMQQNNEKIRIHGLRANAIVKDMLMESRSEVMPRELTDINKLLRENFDLAYQSFKTRNPGFSCDIKLYIQAIPKLLMEQRQMGRVLLNLFDNALYATKEKMIREKDFKPRIIIKTTLQDGFVKIFIEDNGKGIPAEIIKDIFNPFYTTKPTGEGTGLGLSICFDIITKRHQGTISVESEVGQFTRFNIELPLPVNQLNA